MIKLVGRRECEISKKMAIIISTMVGENYGSALQGYALQQAFTMYGNVDSYTIIIDNRNYIRKITRKYSFILKKMSWREKKIRLSSLCIYKDRNRKIWGFYNSEIKLCRYRSVKEAKLGEINAKVLVCGSDQIWNPQFIPKTENAINWIFYGKLGGENNIKKYSYAASLAVSKVDIDTEAFYKKNLKDFLVLSVREQTGVSLLKSCVDNNIVRQDVDPVLLLPLSIWKEKVSNRFENEKFIFVYMLREQQEILEYAVKLGDELGVSVIYIGETLYNKQTNIKMIVDASVEDFLSLISNARVVVTNSFHATIFSIIFHKNFLSSVIKKTGSRVKDLLEELQLTSRILDDQTVEYQQLPIIDYTLIDVKILQLKKDSVEYIKQIALADKGEKCI